MGHLGMVYIFFLLEHMIQAIIVSHNFFGEILVPKLLRLIQLTNLSHYFSLTNANYLQ